MFNCRNRFFNFWATHKSVELKRCKDRGILSVYSCSEQKHCWNRKGWDAIIVEMGIKAHTFKLLVFYHSSFTSSHIQKVRGSSYVKNKQGNLKEKFKSCFLSHQCTSGYLLHEVDMLVRVSVSESYKNCTLQFQRGKDSDWTTEALCLKHSEALRFFRHFSLTWGLWWNIKHTQHLRQRFDLSCKNTKSGVCVIWMNTESQYFMLSKPMRTSF